MVDETPTEREVSESTGQRTSDRIFTAGRDCCATRAGQAAAM